MKKKNMKVDSALLCQTVVEGMKEKKAEIIAVINLKDTKNAVADYFVISSGNSDSHLDAICDSVEEQVTKSCQQNPWHREGKGNKEWVLLDYVDVVAHVFKKDRREFYALEQLWGDANIEYIKE